ncbi:GTPase-associated system all-helical protein GASH [Neomegalonema perideroedes]|uniref:GTPase-associated system all-helical protein GASH n=1 Tax=Neomegalonema perideroedes TaxID=217219 RepID=UPI00036DD100|nr:GTPase-associated system all-helical protein GASH [Neomegalonema perideroedes]
MADDDAFDFADAFRDFQPTAERSLVEARVAALAKLSTEARNSVEKIVGLTHIAYGIPLSEGEETGEWLQATIREKEAGFSLSRDREDARIMSAIVLESTLQAGNRDHVATLLLAATFADQRRAPGTGKLELAARDIFSDSARNRGLKFSTRISKSQWRDTSKAIAGFAATFDATTVKTALDAVVAEAKAAEERAIEKFNVTLNQLTVENVRLAEEVDLLWWHLGGWSYILKRPLDSIEAASLPFVIGSDVAQMVNDLPGPHGALGIIRRALGTSADERQTIAATLRAVEPGDRFKLLDGARDKDVIASLHYGLGLLDDEATATSFTKTFHKRTALTPDTKLTRFEIAAQAYFERLFIKGRWL